jgi:hypothetical protein
MALFAFSTMMAQAAFYAAGAWCLWNIGMDFRHARRARAEASVAKLIAQSWRKAPKTKATKQKAVE